ncbi:DUF2683 family protein [Mucilaginibacter gotjawali]|uniref:Uncharacterized protein n=2 Tax=Mucilaginibacter gotjawali TaxID=1550579 RepID=A0A839SH64_9SPHI|nr:DUF2683 family protein [Mucilaginibacter gotjawali]MBB3056643.1 hypothetical protein [Mucilaginibacter gotjawali]BAU52654.1 hypothetical protein MgSA37_00816 [Mucilaginibacter gotjawali]
METLIMHPPNKEHTQALKAIAKAWKIRVETSPYDPAFVAMVKKAEKRGNYKELDPNNIGRNSNCRLYPVCLPRLSDLRNLAKAIP